MQEEIWRKVDFIKNINPNYYEVSNLGRVKSFPKSNYKNTRFLKPRRNGRENSDGKVMLNSDGYHINIGIGRLVALAFIPNEKGYKYVRHKDNDKNNNCVENLEWCTKSMCDTRRVSNEYIKNNDNVYKLIINGQHEVLFNVEDYDLVNQYHWNISDGYARSGNIMMHRLIMNFPSELVDHIDHNRLNNTRNNLRTCNSLQNAFNRDSKNAKYGVFGVRPVGKKWVARITYKGKKYNLGTYTNYNDAVNARINKELELYGEFSSYKDLVEEIDDGK